MKIPVAVLESHGLRPKYIPYTFQRLPKKGRSRFLHLLRSLERLSTTGGCYLLFSEDLDVVLGAAHVVLKTAAALRQKYQFLGVPEATDHLIGGTFDELLGSGTLALDATASSYNRLEVRTAADLLKRRYEQNRLTVVASCRARDEIPFDLPSSVTSCALGAQR